MVKTLQLNSENPWQEDEQKLGDGERKNSLSDLRQNQAQSDWLSGKEERRGGKAAQRDEDKNY